MRSYKPAERGGTRLPAAVGSDRTSVAPEGRGRNLAGSRPGGPPHGRGCPGGYITNLYERPGSGSGGGGGGRGLGGAWAGPGLHRARQDGGHGDPVSAADPRIAAHRSPPPHLILLGLPGPNQVMGRRARQGWGHGAWGWGETGRRDGGQAHRQDPDSRVSQKVTPGPLRSCGATPGPGRDGGGKGPAFRSTSGPGPGPEERRGSSLPGLSEAPL